MEKRLNKVQEQTSEVSEFNEFREAIAFQESSDNYKAVNRFGYLGRYQFGNLALTDLGISDYKGFLNNPKLQDEAFLALCRINKYRLRHFITKFEREEINGIQITESGLLASAHLVGAGAVKKYLNSCGTLIAKDGNKVTLEKYLKLFSGFNLKCIEAKRSIKLT